MLHEPPSGPRLDTLGRPVFIAQWGPMIAKSPFLHCVLRGAKPGHRVAVGGVDSRGECCGGEFRGSECRGGQAVVA